jgi:tape measure domain-containing protein
MAKLGDLVVRIGADTRDLNKQLGRVQRNMRSMTSNFTRLGESMTRSITLPLVGLGAAAVKSAADLETLETSFVSLTGGARQAAMMVAQLNEFTAQTPFQLEQVGNAARQLIASGTAISEVNDQLQFLGDIAATSGSSIEEIAAIFAKVNAKGKVELENLNQLAERGIPIFKALSDATGLLPSELGAGAVSVKQFNETLRSFAEEGGFANGAMERLSQTAAGKFSTALDNLKLAGAELGQTLLPAVTKLLDGVTDLAKRFAATTGATKQMTMEIALLVAGIGPLLIFLPQIIAQITALRGVFIGLNAVMLANPAGLIVAGIAALTAAVVLLRNRTSDAKVENDKFIRSLANLDKQAQINHVKEQIRELERERNSMRAAQRAEMAAQAAGALGDKLDKQVARGSATRYAEQIDYLDSRIEGLVTTVREMNVAETESTSVVNATTEAITEQGDAVDDVTMSMGQFLSSLENVEVKAHTARMSMGEFFSMLENVEVATERIAETTINMAGTIAGAFESAARSARNFADFLRQVTVDIVASYLRQAAAKALATGNLAGAIGLGIASGLTQRIGVPALANGGVAYGPTMAMIGDNKNAAIDPEVVAPLSKLRDMMGGNQVEVYGRIQGNDIYLSNARTGTSRNRYA